MTDKVGNDITTSITTAYGMSDTGYPLDEKPPIGIQSVTTVKGKSHNAPIELQISSAPADTWQGHNFNGTVLVMRGEDGKNHTVEVSELAGNGVVLVDDALSGHGQNGINSKQLNDPMLAAKIKADALAAINDVADGRYDPPLARHIPQADFDSLATDAQLALQMAGIKKPDPKAR